MRSHLNIAIYQMGLAKDVDAEVERYERVLQENPVDLQLLGIGSNGHIGFNEPGTPFTQRTHKVHLTESTIEANKRFFEKRRRCATLRLFNGTTIHYGC